MSESWLFWIVNQARCDIPDIPFDTFEKAEIVARAYIKAEPTQRVTINHGKKVLASVNTANDGRVWVNMMPGAEMFGQTTEGPDLSQVERS